MKTIYASHSKDAYGNVVSAQSIIECVLNENGVEFTHVAKTDSAFEHYLVPSKQLHIIVLDEFQSKFGDNIVLAQGSLYFAINSFLNPRSCDFTIDVNVYDEHNELIGTVKVGIDMVEHSGADWDEEITYLPDVSVISKSDSISVDLENKICQWLFELDANDYESEMDYFI